MKAEVKKFLSIQEMIEEVELFLELSEEGAEEENELLKEALVLTEKISKELNRLEISLIFTGPYDNSSAILTLHPGAGGLEAQDWVEMLLRMYTRWSERRGYEIEILDLLPGEEAGIKSVTVLIKGEKAYGYLKAERGVHRLVRISPFDAAGRRHTSFASVDVLPEVNTDNEITIDPDDLRIDTFRSRGAGGQHVNTTDSAVRITHLPTGIVVQCQNERSQHSNKEKAMQILKARLADLEEQKRLKELNDLRGEQKEIAWGSQIRSYIFNPYSLVKDHRTNLEIGNIQAVLDGDINPFIEAFFQQQIKEKVKEIKR